MALPAPGYLSNAERTNAEMKQALEDQRDYIAELVGPDTVNLVEGPTSYRLRILRGCIALEEIN